MGAFSVVRHGPSCVCGGGQLKWVWVLLAVCTLRPAPLLSEESGSHFVRQSPLSLSERPGGELRPLVTADVVLHAGGVLRGVVLSSLEAGKPVGAVAGVRVAVLRGGKLVAESKSDSRGRFAVSNLSGGKYVIVVAGQTGVEWVLCRAWTPGTAPPKASPVARVALGEGVVRGQGPLPAVKFSEAALMAGVVVGAVAAPIIYHNSQKSNRVPASP